MSYLRINKKLTIKPRSASSFAIKPVFQRIYCYVVTNYLCHNIFDQ
jgi:hypothetical protein